MKREISDKIFNVLTDDLNFIKEIGEAPVRKVTMALNTIRNSLNDLKKNVIENQFPDKESEIDFFKYVKPRFVAEELFITESFIIDAEKPVGDEVQLKNYYEQELKFIRQFQDKHRFLYQYYLLDGNELDKLYFLRGGQPSGLIIPYGPDFDKLFSTACDYIYARFIASGRLQEFLIQRLYQPEGQELAFRSGKSGRKLKWSGEKTNLVELAYGLYDTIQINEGNVTISEIIEWLEFSLDVNLSRYYRRFTEIKMRKSLSKTRFLDEMRDALSRHIEEGDDFKRDQRGYDKAKRKSK